MLINKYASKPTYPTRFWVNFNSAWSESTRNSRAIPRIFLGRFIKILSKIAGLCRFTSVLININRSRKISFFFLCFFALVVGCATEAPKKELTLSEQIEVDTKKAQSLSNEFKQRVTFVPLKNAQDFMKNMVSVLLKKREEFQKEKITIEIHDDSDPKLRRFFSFPGTTLSVPISFLKKVEFENELAAALAFEMANIMNRFLAKKVEKQVLLGNRPQLFSKESVFNLTKEDRGDSIRLATNLLDESGYDTRGMASIFKRFSAYYVQETSSDLFQTQVAWMVREAQRAQNEFLPQMKPVVRSGEFIQFKKGLTKVRVHSDE